jgi:hypothetical protein
MSSALQICPGRSIARVKQNCHAWRLAMVSFVLKHSVVTIVFIKPATVIFFDVLLASDYIALPVCGHFSHLLTRGHMPYATQQGAAPNVLPSARRAEASPYDPAPSHL